MSTLKAQKCKNTKACQDLCEEVGPFMSKTGFFPFLVFILVFYLGLRRRKEAIEEGKEEKKEEEEEVAHPHSPHRSAFSKHPLYPEETELEDQRSFRHYKEMLLGREESYESLPPLLQRQTSLGLLLIGFCSLHLLFCLFG